MKVCPALFLILFQATQRNLTNLYPCLAAATQQRLLNIALANTYAEVAWRMLLLKQAVWFKSSRVYDEWVTLHQITSRYNYSRRCPQYLETGSLWKTNDRADISDILSVADPLKDSSRAKEYYDQILPYITDLKECFESFSSSC